MPVIPFPPSLPSSSAQPGRAAMQPRVPTIPSHWMFPADPASVCRARRAVTEALPVGSSAQLTDDIGLLASELVTNALRHGTCPGEEQLVELTFWPVDGHYWLAVSDPGGGRPAVRASDPDACGGRGLILVDAVSAAWAVVPRHPCGKSVVAGIRLHGGWGSYPAGAPRVRQPGPERVSAVRRPGRAVVRGSRRLCRAPGPPGLVRSSGGACRTPR
ncbi:MAG: ATP-binding protein [Streptomycetaceae bacterium]|nr:ATP-binding protein [Streptomycetaceae bacterium]